jgi:hypothetical protein
MMALMPRMAAAVYLRFSWRSLITSACAHAIVPPPTIAPSPSMAMTAANTVCVLIPASCFGQIHDSHSHLGISASRATIAFVAEFVANANCSWAE